MANQDNDGSSAVGEAQILHFEIVPPTNKTAEPHEDQLDQSRLDELEDLMQRNSYFPGLERAARQAKNCFARCLREIHDDRLYRKTHKTFGQYLEDRWDLSKSYGYELIQYIKEVDVSAIADTDRPTSPGQAKAKRTARNKAQKPDPPAYPKPKNSESVNGATPDPRAAEINQLHTELVTSDKVMLEKFADMDRLREKWETEIGFIRAREVWLEEIQKMAARCHRSLSEEDWEWLKMKVIPYITNLPSD
jgi:hypothetical protein